MRPKLKRYLQLALTAICVVSGNCLIAGDAKPIRRADSLPETTPWNLGELSKPPAFEWAGGKEVRSLHYKSETYQGKPTRVFAYYATPGSLAGDSAKDKGLPAMVLVHGGGGQAFDQWARLWAQRGYAAIAMDPKSHWGSNPSDAETLS